MAYEEQCGDRRVCCNFRPPPSHRISKTESLLFSSAPCNSNNHRETFEESVRLS